MTRTITALLLSISITATVSMAACARDKSDDASGKTDRARDQAARATAGNASAARATEAKTPTLDQILARHFEALGGADKLLAAQTLVYSGTKYHDGKEVKISKAYKRGNKLRVEKRDGDTVKVMAYDGTSGWLQDGNEVKDMPAEKAEHFKQAAAIDDALLVYKTAGYEVKLVGTAEVKGNPAYHIELKTNEHGHEERFIDASSYYEVKRVMHWKDKDGTEGATTIYFSDYRDVGDGMMVNHRVDFESDKGKGKFVIESAAYNKPVDDDQFERKNNIM